MIEETRIIRKALTFRSSAIGDCLMGKYFLEQVHAAFPDAKCGIVVSGKSAMIKDLLAAYPWIEVLEANRRSPKNIFSLWKKFKNSDVVETQYAGKPGGVFNFASKVMARALARRGGLIGFTDASKINTFLYDHLIPYSLSVALAELERQAARAAGLAVVIPYPTYSFIHKKGTLEHFAIRKPFCIVHAFASNKGRSLSPERCRELISALHEAIPDMQIVVTGSTKDKEDVFAIARDLPVIICTGATLQELATIISESACVISVDTGVAHIAAQLRRPTIVLATCLGPNWWFAQQYGAGVATFFNRADLCAAGHISKDYPDCLNYIDINAVIENAARICKQS